MKKIVFVSTMISVPWGGSEELWQRAALRLKKSGLDIYVNVKEWPEKPRQLLELEQAGCHVERRGFYFHPSLTRKLVDKFLPVHRRFQSFYDPSAYLQGIKPDLVVVCQGSNQDGLDWMEVCAHLQLPFTTLSQAASESFWPQDDVADKMMTYFGIAKRNYFVSERNWRLTEKQAGTHIPNAKVVRNPFNVPYDVSLPWPSEELYKCACVGRVQPDAKGHDILFEALSTKSWRERNLRVEVYGKGPNLESAKRMTRYFGIESLVVFQGHVSNISEIWKANHALVLPSRYEGLPLSVVEASLSARISIVTDIAGNNEAVIDGETGFLAAAPSAELYNETLERAWSHRSQWQDMGKKAQAYIKTKVESSPETAFANELYSLV